MLTEVCLARDIEFYMCAPNLRFEQDNLRSAALSAHVYLAAISRLLQPLKHGGNAQLTWDDAICYDRGMRLDRLTFDEEGHRLLLEATLKERENIRRYNWLVRETHPTTVNADLVSVWDQIGNWLFKREVERTVPQVHSADNTEIIRLPVGLRHIVAKEAEILDQAIQAREINTEIGTKID